MNIRDKIIVDLYFPQFNSLPCSRFESLFIFLNKNETIAKKKNIVSYTIFPERIMQGDDKRTSSPIPNPQSPRKLLYKNFF